MVAAQIQKFCFEIEFQNFQGGRNYTPERECSDIVIETTQRRSFLRLRADMRFAMLITQTPRLVVSATRLFSSPGESVCRSSFVMKGDSGRDVHDGSEYRLCFLSSTSLKFL